jgi:serine/threonine protein kinase
MPRGKKQDGGELLGAGAYGIVYGRPGLPAVNSDGVPPTLSPSNYASKVFVKNPRRNRHSRFQGNEEELAAAENSIRVLLQKEFPHSFDRLTNYFIIPLGNYYIDQSTLKKEWATYYNSEWLARPDTVAKLKNNKWLQDVSGRGIDQNRRSQVITEAGTMNLNQLFHDTPAQHFPKKNVKGIINVLEGIEMLQTKNLIHCDIKTPNSVVTLDGKFKIIDLGDITKIDNLTPASLDFFEGPDKYIVKKTGDFVGDVLQNFPSTVYFIWPSVAQFFTARAFPLPAGTGGKPLTFEKFEANWHIMIDWNGPFNGTDYQNFQFNMQLQIIDTVKGLINMTNMQDKTLFTIPRSEPSGDGGGGGGDGGEGIGAAHNVTGNMFLENLMNTYIFTYNKESGKYERENRKTWFERNKVWNNTDVGSLFKRIDIFSVGVIFINCLERWVMKVIADAVSPEHEVIVYVKNVLILIAQCCYQSPTHIIPVDPRLKSAILETPSDISPWMALAPPPLPPGPPPLPPGPPPLQSTPRRTPISDSAYPPPSPLRAASRAPTSGGKRRRKKTKRRRRKKRTRRKKRKKKTRRRVRKRRARCRARRTRRRGLSGNI